MALDLTTVYPGQLDPGNPSDYPYGEARNITVPGDGTGTPLERSWLNDLFGFEQSLLVAAGLTPTGLPDRVGNSQYLLALDLIIEAHDFSNLDTLNLNVIGALNVASGATLTVASGATFQCDGSAFFTGVTTFSFPSSFDASPTFNADAFFTDTAHFDGTAGGINALECTGSALFTGQLTSSGLLVAGGGIIVGAPGVIVNGPLHVTGTLSIAGALVPTGAGRVRKRVVLGTDTNNTYGPATTDVVYVVAGSLTSARDYTINDTGAADGDCMRFVNNDSNAVTVKEPGGGNLVAIDGGAPNIISVDVMRIAGTWQITSYGTFD